MIVVGVLVYVFLWVARAERRLEPGRAAARYPWCWRSLVAARRGAQSLHGHRPAQRQHFEDRDDETEQ